MKLKKTCSSPINIKLDLALLKSNQTHPEKCHVTVKNKFEILEVYQQRAKFKTADTTEVEQILRVENKKK